VAEARSAGIRTCDINLEASDNADLFDDRRYGPASEVVPAWVEEMLSSA
jgi:NAD-dependent deacetylase